MFWRRWAAALTLGALLALGPGAGLVQADGVAKRTPSPYASDYSRLEKKFRTVGALKFYEDTENFLRTGQFERAFCRYLILKTHIRGQALYTALTAMVDQRLRFLRSQLRLGQGDAYARSYKRYKRRVRRRRPRAAKPACPPPDQKGTKSPTPSKGAAAADKAKPAGAQATAAASKEKPPAADASPAATGEKADTASKGEKEPPPEEEEKEKATKKKPPPRPSYWERLKRTLQFWK